MVDYFVRIFGISRSELILKTIMISYFILIMMIGIITINTYGDVMVLENLILYNNYALIMIVLPTLILISFLTQS